MRTSKLTKSQTKIKGPVFYSEGGERYQIRAFVRYDDQCGNGHNSFSITGETKWQGPNGRWQDDCLGCIHDKIAKHFPELAPFIKWHLFDSTGPMHYLANTMFHASDRDHRGLLAGEKRQLVNGKTGLGVWERVIRNDKGDIFDSGSGSGNWVDSAEKPVEKLTVDFEPVWLVGEGKKIDLEAARSCAVWPDATLEQLRNETALQARLPALVEAFALDMEKLGFVF